MSRKYAFCLSALALLLSSCSSGPSFDISTANLSLASNMQLCNAYGNRSMRAPEIKAELTKRNLFSQEEWTQIDAKKVSVGMSECALYAAYAEDNTDDVEIIKDAVGDPSAKDVTYGCMHAPVPFCPTTVFQIRSGRIKSIYLGS